MEIRIHLTNEEFDKLMKELTKPNERDIWDDEWRDDTGLPHDNYYKKNAKKIKKRSRANN